MRWIVLILAVMLVTPAWAGEIIYVDDDAALGGDGTCWETAYRFLQDGLADANKFEGEVEIRVAQGIYAPDRRLGHSDRESTFRFSNGLSLYGGFAGIEAADPNACDTETYKTILSGDLWENDKEVNDPWDLWQESTRDDNSYQIITIVDIGDSTIDGFVILGAVDYAAIYVESSHLQINSCTFTGNSGKAIWSDASTLSINHCSFQENCGYGVMLDKSDTWMIGCSFIRNYGEGMWIDGGFARLNNCSFMRNYGKTGGGIYNRGSSRLNNCLFVGNSAYESGGGLYNRGEVTLENCVFVGNSTVSNGYGGGVFNAFSSAITLSNCILWMDTAGMSSDEIYSISENVLISYSNIERCGGSGFTWDTTFGQDLGGNIDVDPCFVDIGCRNDNGTPDELWDDIFAIGDYHLKSEIGHWDTSLNRWIQDNVTSPCIDAGDPESATLYEGIPNGGRLNMGMYGGTIEASQSQRSHVGINGDINTDGKVDVQDIQIQLDYWFRDANYTIIISES